MAGWMLYVHALSPIHSGTGQGVGVIDLPVAREKVTTWPYLPGSSIKGVLRDAAESSPGSSASVWTIFGPDTEKASESTGAVWFPDALLLCFPIRSFKGTFAWVTSPIALDRWRRDHLANSLPFDIALPQSPPNGQVLLARPGTLDLNGKVFFEDIDLTLYQPADAEAIQESACAVAAKIAAAVFPGDENSDWRNRFVDRLAVVDDETFTRLAELGTEVAARIRLSDESKTVVRGQLWYEEAVPAETIFAAPVAVAPQQTAKLVTFRNTLKPLVEQTLQIGGHASVGKGVVAIRFGEGSAL